MKAPLNGGTVTVLATRQGNPARLAADSTSVYWTNAEGAVMKITPK